MTLQILVDYLVPALILAAIFGGIRVNSKLDTALAVTKAGFDKIESHEGRIHDLEVSQAHRLGVEQGRKESEKIEG